MPAATFSHKLSKYEVDNHCILLRDDKKVDHSKHLGSPNIVVQAGGKTYKASVNEYYVDGKFQQGIHFEGGAESAFIVEQTLFPNHTVEVTLDPAATLVDGRLPVQVKLFVKTQS